MKKSSFVAVLLGTVSGFLFALGMCMALVAEWNCFRPGVVFGCAGLALGVVTVLVWRRMEHKQPLRLSGRTILAVVAAIVGALAWGWGCASAWSGTGWRWAFSSAWQASCCCSA